MATILDGLDNILEQSLSPGVAESLPGLDDLWNDMFTTSMGVNAGEIGQDYTVIHTFSESLSGAIKWQPAGGDTIQTYDSRGPVDIQADVSVFPGLSEHAMTGFNQKKISLAKAMGNVIVPHEWIRAARLSAAATDGAQSIIRGAAKNAALAEINAWYSMNLSTEASALGLLAKNATFDDVNGTEDGIILTIKSGSIRNFFAGMAIDILDANDYLPALYTNLIVTAVRYVPDETNDTGGYGQVVAVNRDGTDLNDGTPPLTGWAVVRSGSHSATSSATGLFYGPVGPEFWLAVSGSKFNIDIGAHMQFQSVVKDVSGVLTDQVLNRYAGRLFNAYGKDAMCDTLITSMGVTNSHVENSDGLNRWDRTGKAFEINAGWELGAIPYILNGMKMKWRITPFMPSESSITAASQTGGRLWGLKMRDQNIVRYVPPALPQSKSQEPFHREVEFMYPLVNSIFKPYHARSGTGNIGGTTQFQEAPFYRWVAFAPKTLMGLKLTGLTESL